MGVGGWKARARWMNAAAPQFEAAPPIARWRSSLNPLISTLRAERRPRHEAALLEAALAAQVVGVGDEPDAPQAQLAEGVAEDEPDGVRTVAAAPATLLADDDRQLRAALAVFYPPQPHETNRPAVSRLDAPLGPRAIARSEEH